MLYIYTIYILLYESVCLSFSVRFNFWVMVQRLKEEDRVTCKSGHVVKFTQNHKAVASVLPTLIDVDFT